MDQSRTYEASIDIRAGAQDQPPPDADTQVAPVEVRCGVGARLTGLGDGITVDDAGEWMYLEFDTPGVFEWAWDIRATKVGDFRVQLQLRPAVARRDGGYVVPGNEDPSAPTVTFESAIVVQAGFIDRLDAWFQDSWPKIAGIGAVVGGALLGLTAWGRNLVRTLLGRQGASAVRIRPRDPVKATARRQKARAEPVREPDEHVPAPDQPRGSTRLRGPD